MKPFQYLQYYKKYIIQLQLVESRCNDVQHCQTKDIGLIGCNHCGFHDEAPNNFSLNVIYIGQMDSHTLICTQHHPKESACANVCSDDSDSSGTSFTKYLRRKFFQVAKLSFIMLLKQQFQEARQIDDLYKWKITYSTMNQLP